LWIKDGGDVITLSKRLGHATPQVTMSTYADEIEEANDNTVRRARVNAMFEGTSMASRLGIWSVPRAGNSAATRNAHENLSLVHPVA
jgi:hypothetical protein